MRVLIPVDGSAGSFEAARQIGPLLRPERDSVALYCHPPQVAARRWSADKRLVEGAQHALATSIFDEARGHLPESLRSSLHTILGQQDPKIGILLAAEQWSADLIVMGARGLTVLERMLLGSVSRAVVHACRIPVWIARPAASETPQTPRVLVACDCPDAAKRPLSLLGKLAWPDSAHFTVMTVIESIFAGRVPVWLQQQARGPEVEAMVQAWAREHDEESRASQARMQELVRELGPPLGGAQTLVVEGEPAHLILSTAERDHSSLVVVGARGRHTLGSAILGSTSEAVINHARSSVLVVPHLQSP
jgi:nucleotide-binding universal stress UspA family protein